MRIMTSYGMNTQEGGAMCQVLDECAQTLATTHRGGVLVEIQSPSTGTSAGTARPSGTASAARCSARTRTAPRS